MDLSKEEPKLSRKWEIRAKKLLTRSMDLMSSKLSQDKMKRRKKKLQLLNLKKVLPLLPQKKSIAMSA